MLVPSSLYHQAYIQFQAVFQDKVEGSISLVRELDKEDLCLKSASKSIYLFSIRQVFSTVY